MIKKISHMTDIPASWLAAIVEQESNFRPDAKVIFGTDGSRGGAWGLSQMTYHTARGLGYEGRPEGLLEQKLNLELCAKLLKQLSKRFNGRFEDIACAYNSGKSKDDARRIATTDPLSSRRKRYTRTINEYVPRVVSLEAKWLNEFNRRST